MPKLIDLSGKRFSELVVEKLADYKIKNRPAWVCRCDCGEFKTVRGDSLKTGDVKCCGRHKTQIALKTLAERSRIRNRKYPTETDSHSRLYTLWRAMLWRCNDPSHVAYSRYGGAGIKVCQEWQNYSGFMKWAISNGYESTLTIDRTDNGKGYEPSNCRWITPKANSRNRKCGLLLLEAFGEKKPLVDWAEDRRCRISLATLRKRINARHPAEFALTATESQARSYAKAKDKWE